MSQMKKRRKQQIDAKQESVLEAFDREQEEQSVASVSAESMQEQAYREHQEKSGIEKMGYRPWVQKFTDEEKALMAGADMRLSGKARRDPAKNANLFPEKEIVEERF